MTYFSLPIFADFWDLGGRQVPPVPPWCRHDDNQAKSGLPWVPEPQNLNERKLVRGKERRKKGGSGQMITQPRFGADQRDYESIRSPFAQ